MALLTKEQYGEYMDLLTAWVEAEKLSHEAQPDDTTAAENARRAYAEVKAFRERYGLTQDPASVQAAAEAQAGNPQAAYGS